MQLESSVTLFDDTKVETRFAELQITADGITSEVSKKVGNDEIISRINQSAEAVTINANKVNIEGAAIFSSGRLSQSSLDGAYDASGSATGAVDNLKSDMSSGSGTTVINGGHIATGTLSASAVNANSGTFNTANIPNLSASKITSDTLDAARIGTGSLAIGKLDSSAQATINSAGTKATNYITDIGNDGIRVHDAHTSNNSIVINSGGMEVFRGGQSDAYSVAKYGSSARIGKTNDTNVAITAASTDSGIKMNVKNKAGTSSVRIADIGFDNTQGYEDDKNFPKGAWFTLGDRGGTAAQRGYYSLVSGFNNIASHNASVSFGINNRVYAPCGLAVGIENEVGDSSKTSRNSYTDTNIGNCSAAIGYGLKTGTGTNQLVCGEYNQTLANGAPFVVGIGYNNSNRRNGFVVNGNGDAILYGTLTQGSDRRLKEHIDYLGDEAVEFIDGLKPAHYFKDGEKQNVSRNLKGQTNELRNKGKNNTCGSNVP